MLILRRFLNPHEAQIKCEQLKVEGIHAITVEAASFDPALNAAQGTILRVEEHRYQDADTILRKFESTDEDPTPGGEDVVRCPRCELEYCYFGYPRGENTWPWARLFYRLFSEEKWHCTKCEHVWLDPKEGAAEPSMFAPDDPRPVFVLLRNRRGMGAFVGLVLSYFLIIAVTSLPLLVVPVGAALGWIIGGALTYAVCSKPSCRVKLTSKASECHGCKSIVAGTITSAGEHYARVAEVRREFAALRSSDDALP